MRERPYVAGIAVGMRSNMHAMPSYGIEVVLYKRSDELPRHSVHIILEGIYQAPAVFQYLLQDSIRAIRPIDEEPVISVLIVDGELMIAIGKVDPGLSDMIGDKVSDDSALQLGDMIA